MNDFLVTAVVLSGLIAGVVVILLGVFFPTKKEKKERAKELAREKRKQIEATWKQPHRMP